MDQEGLAVSTRASASCARREPVAPARTIRVMIVDDSIVARAVLARMLAGQPDIAVVAQAGSGHEALALVRAHKVDVILLDLEMPGMGGLEALPELLAAGEQARILVVSSAAGDGAAASLAALRLGAADTLLKPAVGGLAGSFAGALIDRLRRIADAPQGVAREHAASQSPVALESRLTSGPLSCVAIGSSTGGVHALASFFAAYPAEVEVPILITQHLPPPFMPYFAGQLQDMAGRRTRVAEDGMPLTANTILLAPGNAHLGLDRTRGLVHVRLDRRPSLSGCMPSVDVMLSSVARQFGAAAVGVVLSGMGRDGLAGAGELHRAGGELLAQDAPSSVVWGMPGAVAAAGIARAVLPPARLAHLIGRRIAQGN